MFRKNLKRIDMHGIALRDHADNIKRLYSDIKKAKQESLNATQFAEDRLDDRISGIMDDTVYRRARYNAFQDHYVNRREVRSHNVVGETLSYILECSCGFAYETKPANNHMYASELANAASQLHEEGVL